MSMFNKGMKIGEGQKYDATQVSTEGMSAEELAAAKKKDAKMIEIYKALTKDGKDMSKLDLALAMDGFSSMDADGNGKLSKKELEAGAEQFNKQHGTDISGKDLKNFMKATRKATKDDEKESVKDVIQQDLDAKAKAKAEVDAKAKAEAKAKAIAEAEAEIKAETEAKAKADAKTDAAEQARINTPKEYTVKPNETVEGLLRKSLKGKGIENPTAEQLKEAKEEFIQNNPNAIKGSKGNEYLYRGDVVKIAGDLKDEPADPAKPADPVKPADPANPAKPADPVKPADPANPAKPADPVKPADPAESAAPTKTEKKPVPAQKKLSPEKFKDEFDSSFRQVKYINEVADKYGEEAAKELIDKYDENAKKTGGKAVKDQLILNGTTFIDSGRLQRLGLSKFKKASDAAPQKKMSPEQFTEGFDDAFMQVKYINEVANKYGEETAKGLIDKYDENARKTGGKSVKDQLILTGTTFIDSGRLQRLGLSKFQKSAAPADSAPAAPAKKPAAPANSAPAAPAKKPAAPANSAPAAPAATPSAEPQKAASNQKSTAQIQKQIAKMNSYAVNEELPNGYSKRDVPGYNDGYFDKNGNRISEKQYNAVRGPKSRAINNMVKSPIMEKLPNGYTRRDTPGPTNRCYDKDGNQISEAEFNRAKNPDAGKMTVEKFTKQFNKTMFSVSYLNDFADKYGEAATKKFIEAYDADAKKKGEKTIKDQLILNGTTFIDAGRLKRLGLSNK